MVLFAQRLTYLLDSVSNADVNLKLCPWQDHTWHNRPNGWSMLEKATMSSITEGNRRLEATQCDLSGVLHAGNKLEHFFCFHLGAQSLILR